MVCFQILYYEAAIQLPKLLADIQDLLTEKELRIHVTPEELEILRESAPPEDTKIIAAEDDTVEDVDDGKDELVKTDEQVRYSESEQRLVSPTDGSDTSDEDRSSSSDDDPTDDDDVNDARTDRDSTKYTPQGQDYGSHSGYSDHNKYENTTTTSSSDDSSEDVRSLPRAAFNANSAENKSTELVEKQQLHALSGSRQNDELVNSGKTRWESEENLDEEHAQNPVTDDIGGTDLPEPDPEEARRWDEEKLRIAKRLWEDRQRAKRKREELTGTSDYYDPAEPNDPDTENSPDSKRSHLSNDMSRLEDIERAKILPDTCQDDSSTTEYEKTKWTKDRLQSMREAWEARKNK